MRGAPDRHQATAWRNSLWRIATWNVRTLYQDGKLQNVTKEMKRNKVDILGISEARWTSSGKFNTDGTVLIYSGLEKERRSGVALMIRQELAACLLGYWAISDRVLLVKMKGSPFDIAIVQVYAPTSTCSEEDLETFYEDVNKAMKQCKSQDNIIVMGDVNAKVGKGRHGNIVGPYGLGERNVRGDSWVEWCESYDQVIMNTWFQQHPRRLWTWRSPDDNTKNQIDFITINNRFRNAVHKVKGYPGADCNTDHVLLVATVKLKLKKVQRPKKYTKLDQLYQCGI